MKGAATPAGPTGKARAVARAAAVACAAGAGYCACAAVASVRAADGSAASAVLVALMVALALAAAGTSAWAAVRLWAGPSAGPSAGPDAGAIRLGVGVASAGLALAASTALTAAARSAGWNAPPDFARWGWVSGAAGAASLALAGAAYVGLTRRLIRAAGVPDPPDPAGHEWRVRAYALMMSVMSFTAFTNGGVAIEQADVGPPWLGGAVSLGAIVAAVGTYKGLVAWLAPTRDALPPGGGFDVLPPRR